MTLTTPPPSTPGTGSTPLEQRVIGTLGLELAQAHVDLAFLRARLEAVMDTFKLMDESAEMSTDTEGVPSDHLALVPMTYLLMLRSLLA